VTDTANLEFVTISAYLCSVLERTERTSLTAMFIQNSATSTSMKFLASKVALVFLPSTSFRIAPAPKLDSLSAHTNNLICASRTSSVLCGVCVQPCVLATTAGFDESAISAKLSAAPRSASCYRTSRPI
jgi:hypothetical protein